MNTNDVYEGGFKMVLLDKMYNTHLDDECKEVVILLLKAREIGRKAANNQLLKLQKAGLRVCLD